MSLSIEALARLCICKLAQLISSSGKSGNPVFIALLDPIFLAGYVQHIYKWGTFFWGYVGTLFLSPDLLFCGYVGTFL